ncbi:hypothetical protein IU414_06325 [Nocardia farcinica]|uniref:hypothetical protein n=1 Tax=Nocardia farcinica TaxID=37329 RepID=UPI0018959170|nr:hypothetical protein [Nocardia farcinica]MBF6373900.1 hypothetical protein [Nocardia farcinica]MBF6584374.1 hypothetical protein [Nocardia farcinica]
MNARSFVSVRHFEVPRISVDRYKAHYVLSLGDVHAYLTDGDARALLAALSSAVLHSPECEALIAEWSTHPSDSVEFKLAEFAATHSDAEIRDELIIYIDEDPVDSVPVRCARQLWPTLTKAVTA